MANTIPVKPSVLEAPFANNGERQTVLRSTDVAGRASLDVGFPAECSLALEQGGIPPSRIDFNGIFNMITVWLHYLQSGGMFAYNQTVNYVTPGMVFYNGTVYLCIKDNGPQVSGAGIKIPGASGSETYWKIGFGNPTVNQYGNNANAYITSGVYFVADTSATTNFPVPGTGGFLSVAANGNNISQSFVLRTDATKTYVRASINGGTSWTAWTKILTTADVRGDAYCQRYISTALPDNAIGQDNDLWIVWR